MNHPSPQLKLVLRSLSAIVLACALAACGSTEPPAKEKAPASAPKRAPAGIRVDNLPENAPRLAIVMDDLGRDRGPAERLLALGVPITFSVIPSLPHSTWVASEAHQQGREVILHLPMASNGARGPAPAEPVELHAGLSPQEVEGTIGAMLETVPNAVGVNNHQGSSATQNRPLMQAVMNSLKTRNLYFLDSRTSAASIAYDVAQDAGLRAAYRTEFLDDEPERSVIVRQLQSAERRAHEFGWAIAIGHPHQATLAVLEEMLPQLAARGVRLVFVSQIAR